MKTLALSAVLALSFTSGALAQSVQNFTPCKFSQSTSVEVSNGVEVRRVSITDNQADYAATAFLPGSDKPTPGIVFSHSAMKGSEGSADLLRFAYALARAGSASIVLDGMMSWNQADASTGAANQRSPHLLACAGQWLLLNAPIDRNHLATAGYRGQWGAGETPECMPGENPCWNGSVYLNFGESADHETANTRLMFTRKGRIEFANFAQRHLGLQPLQPAWLDAAVLPQ